MATQIRHPARDLYEQDFYAWSRRQAELLRLKRFTDLDLAHLIEEVEDLGETVYRSVRSRVRTLRDYGEPAAADALPRACPYSLDQIISDWLP